MATGAVYAERTAKTDSMVSESDSATGYDDAIVLALPLHIAVFVRDSFEVVSAFPVTSALSRG